jgi:hypothetical protein
MHPELELPDDVEPPRSKVWHFRFESDVSWDDPELVKMMWTDETGKAQAVTAGHSCWGTLRKELGLRRPLSTHLNQLVRARTPLWCSK